MQMDTEDPAVDDAISDLTGDELSVHDSMSSHPSESSVSDYDSDDSASDNASDHSGTSALFESEADDDLERLAAPSPLLKLPDEVLSLILEHVATTPNGFSSPMGSLQRTWDLEPVRSAMLTCRKLVPAATRALFSMPEFCFFRTPEQRLSERVAYRAWLFRKLLADKPERAAMIRNLANLPTLIFLLSKKVSRRVSAIARSVPPREYQRDILELAVATPSLGVLLLDPEDAQKVGRTVAGRQLSYFRITFGRRMDQPVAAFSAFLNGWRERASTTPSFATLRIGMGMDENHDRRDSLIDEAQPLLYKVRDLELGIEIVDLNKAASFLPSDGIAGLARLRYGLMTTPIASVDFDVAPLKERIDNNQNAIVDFAVASNEPYEDPVYLESYADPRADHIHTITYPPDFFRLFPAVERLVLMYGGNMTIKKLDVLADCSPRIKSLRLPFTFWTIPASDLVGTPGSLTVFEAQLVATLDRFEHLKRVHLGIFPFQRSQPRKALRKWARRRGIRFRVSLCFVEGESDINSEFSSDVGGDDSDVDEAAIVA
ncbi:hypothetical protein JCM10908_003115 [Rhodotorula pacifica]|uniref:uncharacterized protein n=1 Tax=Rhodotorula pacifica TaxID=1495444 RepID=UPI00316C828C